MYFSVIHQIFICLVVSEYCSKGVTIPIGYLYRYFNRILYQKCPVYGNSSKETITKLCNLKSENSACQLKYHTNLIFLHFCLITENFEVQIILKWQLFMCRQFACFVKFFSVITFWYSNVEWIKMNAHMVFESWLIKGIWNFQAIVYLFGYSVLSNNNHYFRSLT